MKNPNIVMILCDDLGWGDISCLNPDSKINTPCIDQLASEGLSFTNAHAPSAVCTPSRYSTLTGRYCWRTKELKESVNSGYSPALIKNDRKTIATELKKVGYNTACIGKWHIGMDWQMREGAPPHQDLCKTNQEEVGSRVDFTKEVANAPVDCGFDYYYGISGSLDMPPFAWMENNKLTEVPTEFYPAKDIYGEGRTARGHGVPNWVQEEVLPTIINKSCQYIKDNSQKDDPYFLYVPINGPHTPVVPNKEWIGKSGCGLYGDFVMEIDNEVGKILQAIKDGGDETNTIVIFTSDNGPETITREYATKYNHQSAWKFRGFKRDNWEGGHRVPMLFKWPKFTRNATNISHYVELTDIPATLCDIVGHHVEDDFCEDSFSFSPNILYKNYLPREFTIHNSVEGKWAIRKGKWKVLLHAGSGGNDFDIPDDDYPVQVYDMEKDPFETTNLYEQEKEVVKELKKLCLESIYNGRTSPGNNQPVETDGDWRQLAELVSI